MEEKKVGRPKGKPYKTDISGAEMIKSMAYCHKIGFRHGYIASKLGGDWPKMIKTLDDLEKIKDVEKEADRLYSEYEQAVGADLSGL